MGEAWLMLELAGYAALLLWGLHMVQSGIQRAYGALLVLRGSTILICWYCGS